MKKILIVLVLFLVAFKSNADMGYCFKYKLRIELKDSNEVTGYFIYSVYDEYFGSIDSFDTILKRVSGSYGDSLTIYTEIYKIDSLNIGTNIYSIYATPKNQIEKVYTLDIINSKILKIETCCSPVTKLDIDSYYVEHCCIPVISELSKKEINKMQSEKPHLNFIYRDCPDEVLLTLVVISFNNSLTKDEIEKKISISYCEKGVENYQESLKYYVQFKDHLRKEKVIVLKNCF